MPTALPEEFQGQYEAELVAWLRRRALWFALAMTVLWGVLGAVRTVKLGATFSHSDRAVVASLISALLKPGLCLALAWWVYRQPPERATRGRLIVLITALVVAMGAISELTAPFITARIQLYPITGMDAETAARLESKLRAVVPLVLSVIVVFMTHFSASIFVPWSPREALRPLLWLLPIAAVAATLESAAPLWLRLTVVAILPAAGVPGFLLSWWRYAHFRKKFGQSMVAARYGEMKRELGDARRIHEALFPPPITRGAVRMAYRYEPMRQIGGDFLYASPVLPAPGSHDRPLSVVLIDVTGHGVPAALTVSGLHSELERAFSLDPEATPGAVLAALNRHGASVLARHSVFPTALCLRADPAANTLTWASAGHPPAFLRRASGEVEELGSTTMMLGVLPPEAFDPGERTLRFARGDAALAFTDGASEALDAAGHMLRPSGVRDVVAAARAALADAVMDAVIRHRSGQPTDDTLIVEVSLPQAG
jgi:hypothetical protein